MNIHKAKMNEYLLNLALSPRKQMKTQNKTQLIYTKAYLYTMNIIVPWTWEQDIIISININYNKNE